MEHVYTICREQKKAMEGLWSTGTQVMGALMVAKEELLMGLWPRALRDGASLSFPRLLFWGSMS